MIEKANNINRIELSVADGSKPMSCSNCVMTINGTYVKVSSFEMKMDSDEVATVSIKLRGSLKIKESLIKDLEIS